ncbi:hypothetical protein HNQ71_006583 [Mesorhizobium sangaii]|uniref:Uncharacterized protein n=1 Tax=Mesorhizobium sangaii TaxID=505389 RepID=A0A841PEX6_9HYPH|nr:hypothetical protein [Mesorhizobium sangaii]
MAITVRLTGRSGTPLHGHHAAKTIRAEIRIESNR